MLSDNAEVALEDAIEPFVDNVRLEGLPKLFIFDVTNINANGMALNFVAALPDVYLIWNKSNSVACGGTFIP